MGACKKRGYTSNVGKMNWKKFFGCTSCRKRVPHKDALFGHNDERPRCPCCNTQLRTGSFCSKTKTKPHRLYVIELDV